MFSSRRNTNLSWLGLISLLSIMALLCLQVFWLYSSYTGTYNKFVTDVEEALQEACNEEQKYINKGVGEKMLPFFNQQRDSLSLTAIDTAVSHRRSNRVSPAVHMVISGRDTLPEKNGTTFYYSSDTFKANGGIQRFGNIDTSHTYAIASVIKMTGGTNFTTDLPRLDSLYRQALLDRGLHVEYALEIRDTTGRQFDKNSYHEGSEIIVLSEPLSTQHVYIGDKESFNISLTKQRVIARVQFTPVIIFRQMAGILILSIVLFLIIVFCLIYQLSIIHRQKTAAKMKNDFIANFTHELKTPIAVVYAALDAIEHDPGKISEAINVGKTQLKRLSDSVEKILSLSVEKQEKLTLHSEVIVLNEWLPSLLEPFFLRKDKEIAISVSYAAERIPIVVDRAHFANVLNNIIDNAIKYSGDHVRVAISCERLSGAVVISVQDNGRGIPKDDLKKIFNRFYRGTAAVESVKGFGLGLNYVKTIVELYNGTITVESEIGQGSRFTITIPHQNK